MKKRIEVLDITGTPAAGNAGNALIDLPTGVRIHDLKLVLVSGAAQQIAAGFNEIKVLRNGKPQRVHTLAQLDALNALRGQRFAIKNDVIGGPAVVPIYFSEWDRKQYAASEVQSWDIGENESLQIEVGVLAAATAPNIKCIAVIEDDVQLSARPITKWFRNQHAMGGSDTFEITKLARKDRYQLISFYDPTGATIDKLTISRDGVEIFKRTKVQNDAELIEHDLVPVAGRFDVVCDISDSPADLWDMNGVKKLEVLGELSGGGTGQIVVISQREGAPE